MNSHTKKSAASEKELNSFLQASTSAERIHILEKWKTDGISIDDSIIRGLMKLPVAQNEIILAMEICSTESKANFELWIMDHLLSWDQNIAAIALRAWARNTECILWHRLIPMAMFPGLPQRIRYTILDIAPFTHGYEIAKATTASPEWEDLSSAFHALLFERSIQYDLNSTRLTNLAWKIANEFKYTAHPEHKALFPALAWLCKQSTKDLKKWCASIPQSMWKSALDSMISVHEDSDNIISKLEKSIVKSGHHTDIIAKIPAIWSRQNISPTICEYIVAGEYHPEFTFAGVPHSTISTAMQKSAMKKWTKSLISHLPMGSILPTKEESQNGFCNSYDSEKFPTLEQVRKLACTGKSQIANDSIKDVSMFSAEEYSTSKSIYSFSSFFARLSNTPFEQAHAKNIWTQLDDAFANIDQCDLNVITSETRKHKGIVPLAQITLLSRMKGKDEAVLKLLDHIRSEDECELRAVARALGQIHTPRSHLELIAMLTRPNSTIAVKQDIAAILAGCDLSTLQNELRSAVQDISIQPNIDDPLYQIKDELSGLLLATPDSKNAPPQSKHQTSGISGEINLDQELTGMIPHYNKLSSEVKRALRTALFFNKTIEKSQHLNSIDLSPLIDMQYKAMELLYREFFEDTVSNSLQKGAIQRKLDVIGYARPIVRQMDDFEAYIASLPVVRDIPFFSKFKLRKMLRAICQFEPGRRFTLDGLKAFGLYFLVFGRQDCRHGLAHTFSVGSKNDLELAEFCRELHVFQDFRNRAAHEGFHPDASNDVLGIWRTTATVVQWAFTIKDAQKSSNQVVQQVKAS